MGWTTSGQPYQEGGSPYVFQKGDAHVSIPSGQHRVIYTYYKGFQIPNGEISSTAGVVFFFFFFFFFWINKNLLPKGESPEPTKEKQAAKSYQNKRKTDSTSPKTEGKGHQPETRTT